MKRKAQPAFLLLTSPTHYFHRLFGINARFFGLCHCLNHRSEGPRPPASVVGLQPAVMVLVTTGHSTCPLGILITCPPIWTATESANSRSTMFMVRIGSPQDTQAQPSRSRACIRSAFQRGPRVTFFECAAQRFRSIPTRIPSAFGASAADLESDIVYAILTQNPNMADNKALFHASHGNLGTAAGVTETALGEAYRKFGSQKGLEGRLISILPSYIITPPGRATAKEAV